MPKSNTHHPDVLKWATHCGIALDSLPSSFDWNPTSLKQISTHVLNLGKASDHLIPVMKSLADVEMRLKGLRDRIGISRSHPSSELPKAVVLDLVDNECGIACDTGAAEGLNWNRLGRWIPDVLDRAAAFDPFHATLRQDSLVTVQELASHRVDHIFLLNTDGKGPEVVELKELGPQIHVSEMSRAWTSSGPEVFNAIFEAAFCIHGIRE